jgi:hypothetical protein
MRLQWLLMATLAMVGCSGHQIDFGTKGSGQCAADGGCPDAGDAGAVGSDGAAARAEAGGGAGEQGSGGSGTASA